MMDLSNLKLARGSTKKRKRVGRGQGSGRAGTSTRGHKGAASRSGFSTKVGFEGGQMPLQRRVPKMGFKNRNRRAYVGINLDVIQGLSEKFKLATIDLEILKTYGLVAKNNDLVKILGRGVLKTQLTVKAYAFTKSARRAIETLGGSTVQLLCQ